MSSVMSGRGRGKEEYSSGESVELDADSGAELQAVNENSRFNEHSPKNFARSWVHRLPCSRSVANVTVLGLSVFIIALAVAMVIALNRSPSTTCETPQCVSGPLAALVRDLSERSMLSEARNLIAKQKNDGTEWRWPYGEGQAGDLIEKDQGDVWLDLYPASMVPIPGKTVMDTMGDVALWKELQDIGITVIHLNPVRRAGGITSNLEWTPTTDGGYDRVSLSVDPLYGTDEDYRDLVSVAAQYNGYVAADIVPGHTGTGADWLLAKMNYKDYPFLYHMIEIKPQDWNLLPNVPEGKDAVNVSPALEKKLAELDYIDGVIDIVIFKTTGVKETNWAVTPPVLGVDGVMRRWVYLHLFKQGQPTLNWLHPSFVTHQLVVGDIVKTFSDLGAKIVRFDANSLLGTERIADNSLSAKSVFHPLSAVTTQLLAMTVRKLGGYSYEENTILSKTLQRLGQATTFGPDLSYDFTIRGGYISALLTGDVRLLKLQLEIMRNYDIGKGSRSIHSLQNHDELIANFNFDESQPDELFQFGDKMMRAADINTIVTQQNFAAAKDDGVRLGEYGGLSTTLTTLVAGRLDINLSNPSAAEVQKVVNGSIMLAAFNALQPGLFQVSAWDLIGALQLESKDIDPEFLADGDLRWLNRGAYDLMGYSKNPGNGVTGLPMSRALFGNIPSQVSQPQSYLNQLKSILKVRKQLKIALGDLQKDLSGLVSGANSTDLVVIPTILPPNSAVNGTQIALLFVNWSTNEVSAKLDLGAAQIGNLSVNVTTPAHEVWPMDQQYTFETDALTVSLPPLGARMLVVKAL